VTKSGDLIYFPAGTELLQYNKEVEGVEIDPIKTYIGPSPIKYMKLEKPINLLLIEEKSMGAPSRDNYSKVWFEGEEWYVRR
tara:strand:+ start:895 stop:1140 length:246 start_codon:yes stop_codon:yes gene_type:complete